jgi:hypothetical protein
MNTQRKNNENGETPLTVQKQWFAREECSPEKKLRQVLICM